MDSYKYYGDIIDKKCPVSKTHIPMNIITRAAQFAPFAALPTHSYALYETERITEDFIILDNQEKERINNLLQDIIHDYENNKQISITYFIKDVKKNGGSYNTIKSVVKKIDEYNKNIILENNIIIPINNILNLSILGK